MYTKYRPPARLRLTDVPKPTAADDEALIQVVAVAESRSDRECLRGAPLYARSEVLRAPRHPILGSDTAGRVEPVGRNSGASARAMRSSEIPGRRLVASPSLPAREGAGPEPAGMTFEEVAPFPRAGVIVLQGIRDRGQIRPGPRVSMRALIARPSREGLVHIAALCADGSVAPAIDRR